jgi:triacylglycerol lipase
MEDFNPVATKYDPHNALWIGKAAALAYQDAAAVQAGLPGLKVQCVSNPATDTEGFVAGSDAFILVAFRGTQAEELEDWLTDLDAVPVDGPVGEVHKGFYDALSSVWNDLVAALQGMRQDGQPLWITGHSLGAALATLAAARLLKENVVGSISGLYTFGQPRTGDPAFAAWFDGLMRARMFRFVNNNDIVPHVPLPPLYKHVGTFLYFDSDGKIQADEGFWGELKEGLEGEAKSLLEGKFKPDLIEDHFMKNYLARLEENVGVEAV